MNKFEEVANVALLVGRLNAHDHTSYASQKIADILVSDIPEIVVGSTIVSKEEKDIAFGALDFCQRKISEERVAILMEKEGPGANTFRAWAKENYPNLDEILDRRAHPERYCEIPPTPEDYNRPNLDSAS